MHEVDGHEVDGTETTVDTSNKLVNRCSKILILLDVLTRRHRKLCENDLADPFGVLGEEELERMQLLRYTLDVVEPIDTHYDLDAIEALFKRCNAFLDRLLLQIL